MSETLLIHEIFVSIQGESTFAGLPCAFVRLSGCQLRCAWCDTPEARQGGQALTIQEVSARALAFGTDLVEVTGGEPLLQSGTRRLLVELCDAGRVVLLETSGTEDISGVDGRVHRIVDLKAPGSGESQRNRYDNLAQLTARDELKMVLASRRDYEWMREIIQERALARLGVPLLVAAVSDRLDLALLARWVLEDRLPVRLQPQLHKLIWGPLARGV